MARGLVPRSGVPVMRTLLFVLALALAFFMTASARAEETAQTPTTPPKQTALQLRAFGGVTRGTLFAMPVGGASGGIGFGGGFRKWWGGLDAIADVTYDGMSTDHGVGVRRLALGSTAELLLWHFRIGAGADLGSTWIDRLSGSTTSAHKHFVGVHAVAGFDFFTIGGITPYIAARADYNAALPTLGLNGGVRYRF